MRQSLKWVVIFFVMVLVLAYGLVAQTPVGTYEFEWSLDEWTHMPNTSDVPGLTHLIYGYDGHNLILYSPLQTDPNATAFGYWINDSTDFTSADIPANSLFRGTFWVSTNQEDHTLVPQLRLAMRNETANFNSLLQINSINNVISPEKEGGDYILIYNTPRPEIKAFEHWFQPHPGSLYPSFDGLTVTFELINYYQSLGLDEGALFLDRVEIDRFDLSSAVFTSTQDFDLSQWYPDLGASQGFYTCDFLTPQPGVIGLTPHPTGSPLQNLFCYGVWQGAPNMLSIDGVTIGGHSYLYRGVLNISSEASSLKDVPYAKFVLLQKQVREGSALGISSNLDDIATIIPDPLGKEYFVYFRPPDVEVTVAPEDERYVYGEFSLMNFWGDDPTGKLYLNSAKLDRIDPDELLP